MENFPTFQPKPITDPAEIATNIEKQKQERERERVVGEIRARDYVADLKAIRGNLEILKKATEMEGYNPQITKEVLENAISQVEHIQQEIGLPVDKYI